MANSITLNPFQTELDYAASRHPITDTSPKGFITSSEPWTESIPSPAILVTIQPIRSPQTMPSRTNQNGDDTNPDIIEFAI